VLPSPELMVLPVKMGSTVRLLISVLVGHVLAGLPGIVRQQGMNATIRFVMRMGINVYPNRKPMVLPVMMDCSVPFLSNVPVEYAPV